MPPQLGKESRSRDAKERRCLASVVPRITQHCPKMPSLRRGQTLGSWHRRRVTHHKIDRQARAPALIPCRDEVACLTEILDQAVDVLAKRTGGEYAEMKRSHRAKLLRRRAACQSLLDGVSHQGVTLVRAQPEREMLDFTTLAIGDDIHHPLLVIDIVAKGGDHPRTILTLGNRTGRIDSAPFWAGKDEAIRGLQRGMLVQVVGSVVDYRDSRQLTINSIRALPDGEVPLHELVPSVGPVDRYWQFLDDIRQRFAAPRLRATVDLFYADAAFRERYEQCPGSPGTGHHALLGGLLQHTVEVAHIARNIARVAHADEELVMAGAMLHDIGKIESYSWERGVFDTTERGRLAGHVAIGAMMFRERWSGASPPPCTPDEANLVEHMILSHHGRLEYGSPVRPLTLEAEILHFADDASAKTAAITEAHSSPEFFPDDNRISTKRIWQLDNRWLMRLPTDFGRGPSGEKNETADQTS